MVRYCLGGLIWLFDPSLYPWPQGHVLSFIRAFCKGFKAHIEERREMERRMMRIYGGLGQRTSTAQALMDGALELREINQSINRVRASILAMQGVPEGAKERDGITHAGMQTEKVLIADVRWGGCRWYHASRDTISGNEMPTVVQDVQF